MGKKYPITDEDRKIMDEIEMILRMANEIVESCSDIIYTGNRQGKRISIFAVSKLLIDFVKVNE